MNKDSTFENVIATVIAIIIVLFVLSIFVNLGDDEPKCIKSGCDNEQAYGSSYCYSHKGSSSYRYNNYSSGSTSSSGSSSSSGSNSTSGSYNKRPSGTTSSYSGWDSYDDGYDAIYDDDDYDWDRYNSDPDYASGVDDAIDELEEYGDW